MDVPEQKQRSTNLSTAEGCDNTAAMLLKKGGSHNVVGNEGVIAY